MNVRKLLTVFLCLCLIFTVALSFRAKADFGDFAGDNDYGGGSDDSDSGYDSGNDYSYDSGDYSSSGSSGSYDSSIWDMLITIAVIGGIVVIIMKPWKKKNGGKTVMPGGQRTDASKLRLMTEYKKLDPNFDEGAFCEKLSNLYVQMQNCWSDRDITPVRPYFTDAYWSQMDRQLQAMRKQGRIDHTERIAVLSVTPRGFFQSGDEDHMIVELCTRIVSYTTDTSGNVLSGSKTAEKFMTYEWNLSRPSGTVTAAGDGMKTVNCPNCGAPVSINQSAKCPYCDAVITLDDHDWAICTIKGISQRTK
jgi:hypothetical protein